MDKERIFKELDKRVGKDLIISYSEVKELSGLSEDKFKEVYWEWWVGEDKNGKNKD